MFPQEFELHRNDSVKIPVFVSDHLFEDFLGNLPVTVGIISLVLIQVFHFNDFCGIGDIDLDRRIPPEISFRFDLFFCESRIDKGSGGIIEIKRIQISRKEIPEDSLFVHLSENLVRELIPFLFGVLFVEDTEGFVFESDAADAEGTVFEEIAIIKIISICSETTVEMFRISPGGDTAVKIILSPHCKTIIEILMTLTSSCEKQILSVSNIVRIKAVRHILVR